MSAAGRKKCSRCGIKKAMTDFSVDSSRHDGKVPQCRECVHEYYLANRTEIIRQARARVLCNLEEVKRKQRKYHLDHQDELKQKAREYHSSHREANLKRGRVYARAHKREAYERNKVWRTANLERSRQYKRQRLESDPEKRRRQNECNREWAHKNPALVRLATLRRSDRVRLAFAHYTLDELKHLLDEFDHQCVCCDIHETQTPEGHLEKDHIVPLSALSSAPPGRLTLKLASLNLIGNIQPLCKRCNLWKGIKVIDYRRSAKARRNRARNAIVSNP